jgi:signal transduction histidine kinase
MFTQARLKLTGWYLLIIMTISVAFSLVIYRSVTLELNRIRDTQRLRFERRFILDPTLVPIFDEDILDETRGRVLTVLGMVNGSILFISAALGYYLAGITLSPIQKMLEDQQQFISDASHELKTPLTAMRTSLEVGIRDRAVAGTAAEPLLRDNLQQVTRLQHLAEGLLDMARSEHLALAPVSIATILEEARREIDPIATARHVKIVAPSSALMIRADAPSLTRALVAILDNGVKYSPRGATIHIGMQHDAHTLRLTVSDRGPGIPKVDLPHVTDRFYRGDKSRTTHGYGLGLPIAKQILLAHHGDLGVVSRVGKGTTVVLSLPYSGGLQHKRA